MQMVGVSKVGLVRPTNEDRFYVGKRCALVADGMGGYRGGDIASTMVIDDVSTTLEATSPLSEDILQQAIQTAHIAVLARSKQPEYAGMGTTCLVVAWEGAHLYWAHVGDCRLYLLRSGTITQISTDHSLVQSLIDKGQMTEAERRSSKKKHFLLRAVGASEDPLLVDTGHFLLQEGDRLLLCSDGLSAYVEDSDIVEVLLSEREEMRALDRLLQLVYDTGARDNVTMVLGTYRAGEVL